MSQYWAFISYLLTFQNDISGDILFVAADNKKNDDFQQYTTIYSCMDIVRWNLIAIMIFSG